MANVSNGVIEITVEERDALVSVAHCARIMLNSMQKQQRRLEYFLDQYEAAAPPPAVNPPEEGW